MGDERAQNQFYVDDHILMLAAYPTPESHRHSALHLIFATSAEETLRCTIEGRGIEARAIAIASGVEHTVATKGTPAVMLLDVTSRLAQNLETLYLRGCPYCLLPDEQADALADLCRKHAGDLATLDAAVLSALGLQRDVPQMDERIADALRLLAGCDTIPRDVFERCCDVACLSPSRFSHLFKQCAGISFRSYLVMVKLTRAYEWYLRGQNATQISVNAGFDSPSHFANTVHRMFGLRFSDFLKSM